MASLLVRNVKVETVRGLKDRAREHGLSVEAEVRAILEAAVRRPLTTAQWAERIAGTFIGQLDPDELRDRSDSGRVPPRGREMDGGGTLR